MSKKIDLKNQSLQGLYILIDYCKKNKVLPTEYIEVEKINKDWLKDNKKYIRIDPLKSKEKKAREEFIKNINKK